MSPRPRSTSLSPVLGPLAERGLWRLVPREGAEPGGAGRRGRHEGSVPRHVLRVPHACSVSGASRQAHDLADDLAARPFRPTPSHSVVPETP